MPFPGGAMPTSLLDKIRTAKTDVEFSEQIPDKIPEEMVDEFASDPPPAEPKGTKAPRRPTAPRASATLKKRVSAELEAYAKMVALGWAMRDGHCGTVMNDQAKAIADSTAELLARNPALCERIFAAGVLGDWAKAAMAWYPVVQAIWAHHFAKTVRTEADQPPPDYTAQYPAYRPGS